MNQTSVAAQAAKKERLQMLTQLERIVFDRCRETGDTPNEALLHDGVLAQRIVDFVRDDVRVPRIESRLQQDVSWLREQVARLKAGVPEDAMTDEERYDAEVEALNRQLDVESEAHGRVD